MKSLFLIAAFLVSTAVFAQHQSIGIVAGPSWMNVKSNESYLEDSEARSGFSFGVTYENRIKKYLLIGVDLMYYQRGFRSALPLTYKTPLEPLLHGSYKYAYNYLALPVKIGFVTGNKISAFANIGLIPSYMVDAKLYLPNGSSNDYVLNSISSNYSSDSSPHPYRENLSDFNLSGLLEVGTNIKLTGRLIFSTTASYQHSFTTITSSDHFDGLELTNYGFALAGVIKYVL